MQKAQADITQIIESTPGHEEVDAGHVVIHEDGTVAPRSPNGQDDNASTRAMMSTKSSIDTSISQIPTIRVSSESGRERREREEEHEEEEDISRAPTPPPGGVNGDTSPDEEPKENGVVMDTLEKPVQAAAGEGEQAEGDSAPSPEPFSFSNKRLCERWLDNLFMVLYEVRCILFDLLFNRLMVMRRTSECGLYLEQRWLISRRSTLHTANPV